MGAARAGALRVLVAAALGAAACTHVVEIDTIPPGGGVSVDGELLGTAPVRFEETTGWKKTHLVEASAEGHITVRQSVEQTEWSLPVTTTSVCCSLALGSPLTGLGVLPLAGLFFARQLPDQVVIALPPDPDAPASVPPPIAY
jgi:PEGA domain